MNAFHASLVGLSVLLIAGVPPAAARAERVPGTRVSMEPPSGFVPARDFQGFMDAERGASIVIAEVAVPIDTYREKFTRQAVTKRGMTVREHGRMTVDSFDGLLIRATDSTGKRPYEAWLLVLGNVRESVRIVANYPAKNAFEFRLPVREALLSVQWDPTLDVPEFEGLGFEIEESPLLKISARYPDALILTEGGRGRTTIQAPFLVVSSSPGRLDFGNLEAFSREQLKRSEVLGDISGARGELKSVAGMPGFEMTADAVEPRSGTALKVYQFVAGEKDRVFLIQAFVGLPRARDFIPEFRAVAESLRPQ